MQTSPNKSSSRSNGKCAEVTRPIIFSSDNPKLILDGRKTQTRRIITKPQFDFIDGNFHVAKDSRTLIPNDCAFCYSPYGVAGDRLWVITIKPLAQNHRYGAGDDGHIYRIDKPTPTKMRSASNGKGYQTITLCENGKKKTALVHLLVCGAFYGPKPAIYDEARHLDGNKSNNTPQNLDWGTRQQNWADRAFKGRGVRGNHWAAKITEDQAAEIRNSPLSQRVLAKKFGLSQSTVGQIKQGNIWQPFPPQSEPPNMPRWASRITLEITKVRVERLQDITEEDAWSEGCEKGEPTDNGGWFPKEQAHPKGGFTGWDCARDWYADLWDSLHGDGAWDKNPWVWMIEFRLA